MIVLIAAGQQPNSGVDPTQPFETIAAFIAATGKGDIADRHHRVQDDLRRRDDPLRADPGLQHDRDPLRSQVPRRSTNERPPDLTSGCRRGRRSSLAAGPAQPAHQGQAVQAGACSPASRWRSITLVALMVQVAVEGIGHASTSTSSPTTPRRSPRTPGIRAALLGTLWLMGVCAAVHRPGRRRDRDLPGGVRGPRPLVQPLHRGQHPEPRRGSLDHLRHPRPRLPRPRAAEPRQGRARRRPDPRRCSCCRS